MYDDNCYLRDILSRIALIRAYTKGGQRAFMASKLAQDAVVRNIEVLGYTWICLSPEAKLRLPDFPWRAIGNRPNHLRRHRDSKLFLKMVWRAVRTSVPELDKALRREFPNIAGPASAASRRVRAHPARCPGNTVIDRDTKCPITEE